MNACRQGRQCAYLCNTLHDGHVVQCDTCVQELPLSGESVILEIDWLIWLTKMVDYPGLQGMILAETPSFSSWTGLPGKHVYKILKINGCYGDWIAQRCHSLLYLSNGEPLEIFFTPFCHHFPPCAWWQDKLGVPWSFVWQSSMSF